MPRTKQSTGERITPEQGKIKHELYAYIEAEMKEILLEMSRQNLDNMGELTRMIATQNTILADIRAELEAMKTGLAEMKIIIFGSEGDPNKTGILNRCVEHDDHLRRIVERFEPLENFVTKHELITKERAEYLRGLRTGAEKAEIEEVDEVKTKKDFKWQMWQVWGLIVGEPIVTALLAIVVTLLIKH